MAALTFRELRARPVRVLGTSLPWRSLAYLLSSMLLAIPTVYAVVLLPLLPFWAWTLAAVERQRVRLLGQEPVPAPPLELKVPPLRNVPARLTSGLGWLEIAAAILHLLIATLLLFFFTFASATLMLLLTAPILVVVGVHDAFNPWDIDQPGPAVLVLLAGCVCLVIFLYVVLLLAFGQAAISRLLLDSRTETLAHQVDALAEEQIALVDAFEAERRRIERDLHDGPQQHLAGAALHLGILRRRLDDTGSPPDSIEIKTLEAAHAEIEHALDAIRGAVTGLRPRTLTEGGLGAALDELGTRTPIHVVVDVDKLRRLPTAVEASLYSVVAEFTANALTHGAANALTITAASDQRGTCLILTDDGRGGADPTRGTGLVGIEHRVRLMRGTLVLDSPQGGPTTLKIDIPTRSETAGATV